METALNEITLVLFTTVAPAGVVGYLIMLVLAWRAEVGGARASARAAADAAVGAGSAFASGADACASEGARADALAGSSASAASVAHSSARRIERYLVVPLVFAISGLIASATHLGTPANALYVITGVGRSPLSNEIAAAVAFLALGGAYWFLSFRDDVPAPLRRALAALTTLAGVAFIAMISLAYSVSTVPTWNLPTGPVSLWLAALASGPFVALLGLRLAGAEAPRTAWRVLLALSLAAAVVNAAVLGAEGALLGGIVTTVQAAGDLVPWLPWVIAAFLVCEAAAVAVSIADSRRARGAVDHVVVSAAAAAMSLAGCFAVRFAFYAMHMTSGM